MENKEDKELKILFIKTEFRKQNEILFSSERTEFEKNVNFWEQRLFSKEFDYLFSEFKNNIDKKEIDNFILNLILLIDALKFFPKKKTIDRLKELGVKNEVFKFMISIDEIKIKIDEINQNTNIYIDPNHSILIISEHLAYKISDTVLKSYSLSTKKKGNQKTEINLVAAYMNTIKLSHKYFNKKNKEIPIKTEDESKIYKLILNFPPETDPYKLLETALKGDVHDSTLKKLFYEPVSFKFDESMKVTEFYFNYYQLFRLIMPNKVLSVSELEAKADVDTRSLKNYFYQDIIKIHFHVGL